MNKESIEKLKGLVSKDESIEMNKEDTHLNQYITFRARKHLEGHSGMVDDDEVVSWAKHFYMESKEDIDKEMEVKPEPQTQEAPKKPKPKKQKAEPKKEQGQSTIFDFLD